MTLKEFFEKHKEAAVAFSGGVDSAYLLYAAKNLGCRVRGYYVKTPFQPEFELADARRLAAEIDVPLTVIPYDILGVKEAAENGPKRCYYCKKALFTQLCSRAAEDGFALILDGTNASDDADDRPGMQALRELEVRSPLRECGITKAQVRSLSKEAGLFTWDKPAYACLATRIPTGTEITLEALQHIEEGEDALFSLGFTDFRLRMAGGLARLQLPREQWPEVLKKQEEITEKIGSLFAGIVLDLQPRKGSD